MLLPLYSREQAQPGRSAVTAMKVWSEERLNRCWESEGSRESLLDVGMGLECGCAEYDQKVLCKKVKWKFFWGENRQFTSLPEEDRWLKDRRSRATRGCKLFVWKKVGLDCPNLLQKEGEWSEAGVKEGMISPDLISTKASPDSHHYPKHSFAVFLCVISASLGWLP